MNSWPMVGAMAEEQWGLFTRQQAARLGMAWSTLSRTVSNGRLERVGHGVYRMWGTPPTEFLDLRVAWLQLRPEVPAWQRKPEQGVVAYRSAAALYGIGELPAETYEFTLATRKKSRRPDVRLHRSALLPEWITDRSGLPVTRPSQIAVDLLEDGAEPEAVATIVSAALRGGSEDPLTFAGRLAALAGRFGLANGDGVGVLSWLLALTGDPEPHAWLSDASASGSGSHVASRTQDPGRTTQNYRVSIERDELVRLRRADSRQQGWRCGR